MAGQSYAQGPPAASVSVKVQVPVSMRSAPFDVDRYLTVPPDFTISVYARVSQPRFMAIAPNGDLLVSQPSTGKVLLIRPNSGGTPLISDFAMGLTFPHDIVFHQIGTTTYVYITESHQINRYVYNAGDLTAHNRQIVVTGLPVASTPELNGTYRHRLKNIVLDDNHKLYVSIASSCNACSADSQSDPLRAAIYQYNADGTGRRLFAQGLRNAEGLAFVPGTNRLWAVVNNRDNVAYPFNRDFNGDGTNDYGKVLQSYVDNHPPEEFTHVQDGGNYGWPFCNPNPDNTLVLMPFDRDYQLNANGQVDCNGMTRISRGIQAHSAPLGLTFLQSTSFANAYRAGAAVGLHGSWNRTKKTGYKVAFFPWNGTTQMPTGQLDLVKGFLNEATQSVLGRPVDVAVDHQGDMLISDDHSNTIYKLSYLRAPENPAGTVAGLKYDYYEGSWNTLPNFSGLSPLKTGTVTNFSLTPRNRSDNFAFRFTGYVQVPANGLYTFYTSSDDGSKLYIGNTLVVNNDGLHAARERAGTIRLRAGKHAITVTFFDNTGSEALGVSYAGPGITKRAIPASALFRIGTGARTIAGTSGEVAPTNTQLRVSPNPGSTWIQLSFWAPQAEQVSIQLTDPHGRNVLSATKAVTSGMNQVDVFVGDLKRGTYTVAVGQKGKPLTGKVVLVR
jgi:glucose/arabinose dehydrogenase